MTPEKPPKPRARLLNFSSFPVVYRNSFPWAQESKFCSFPVFACPCSGAPTSQLRQRAIVHFVPSPQWTADTLLASSRDVRAALFSWESVLGSSSAEVQIFSCHSLRWGSSWQWAFGKLGSSEDWFCIVGSKCPVAATSSLEIRTPSQRDFRLQARPPLASSCLTFSPLLKERGLQWQKPNLALFAKSRLNYQSPNLPEDILESKINDGWGVHSWEFFMQVPPPSSLTLKINCSVVKIMAFPNTTVSSACVCCAPEPFVLWVQMIGQMRVRLGQGRAVRCAWRAIPGAPCRPPSRVWRIHTGCLGRSRPGPVGKFVLFFNLLLQFPPPSLPPSLSFISLSFVVWDLSWPLWNNLISDSFLCLIIVCFHLWNTGKPVKIKR